MNLKKYRTLLLLSFCVLVAGFSSCIKRGEKIKLEVSREEMKQPPPPPTPGSENVTIEGNVFISGSRSPIAGAITASSLDNQIARTDSRGYFLLKTNTPGRGNYANKPYTIKISADGFLPFNQTHTWGDNPTNQTFYLSIYDPYAPIKELAAAIVEREYKEYLSRNPNEVPGLIANQPSREQELQKAFQLEINNLRTSQSEENAKFFDDKEKASNEFDKSIKKKDETEQAKLNREFSAMWQGKNAAKQKKQEKEKCFLAGRQTLERKQMKIMFVQEKAKVENPDLDYSEVEKSAWEDYKSKHATAEFLLASCKGEPPPAPDGRVSIKIEPQSIERGKSANLIWESWFSGKEATIEPEIGKVVGQRIKVRAPVSVKPETEKSFWPQVGYGSTIIVTPQKTTAYKIFAKDWNGKDLEATAEVKVTEPSYHASALRWLGILDDRVGNFNSAISPDGSPDGVFELTLDGQVNDLVLMTADAQGKPCCGQQWDTISIGKPAPAGTLFQNPGDTWVLGIVEEDAATHEEVRTIVNDATQGYYNAALGTMLDSTQPQFPCADVRCGDPTMNPASEPNLASAATILGNWLSPNPIPLNSHWSASPQSIPNTWPVNTESAILYPIDAGSGGIFNLKGNFGVDNGIFVWVNGVYKFGALAPGGAPANEYSNIDLGDLHPGKNFIQILREDHGGATGYTTQITGVAKGSGSKLINRADGSVEPRKETNRQTVKLYAGNSGYFKKGQNFALYLIRPQGEIEKVYTKIETEPSPPTPPPPPPPPEDEVRHEPVQDRDLAIYAVCSKGQASYIANTSWNPKSLELNQGDKVHLTVFGPPAGTEDACYSVSFQLKDFDILLPKIRKGTKQECAFEADKFGRFAYLDAERRLRQTGQVRTADIREETLPGVLIVHKNLPPAFSGIINFDSVDASQGEIEAASYLAGFGISLSGISSGSKISIVNEKRSYEGKAAKASSSPNWLTQTGNNDPVSFTFNFANPVERFSFVRPMLLTGPNGITHPEWSAHAFNAQGTEIAQASESQIASYSDVPAKQFVLDGKGGAIASVRFDSNNRHFAAFSAVLIDDLELVRDNAKYSKEYQIRLTTAPDRR